MFFILVVDDMLMIDLLFVFFSVVSVDFMLS